MSYPLVSEYKGRQIPDSDEVCEPIDYFVALMDYWKLIKLASANENHIKDVDSVAKIYEAECGGIGKDKKPVLDEELQWQALKKFSSKLFNRRDMESHSIKHLDWQYWLWRCINDVAHKGLFKDYSKDHNKEMDEWLGN